MGVGRVRVGVGQHPAMLLLDLSGECPVGLENNRLVQLTVRS